MDAIINFVGIVAILIIISAFCFLFDDLIGIFIFLFVMLIFISYVATNYTFAFYIGIK